MFEYLRTTALLAAAPLFLTAGCATPQFGPDASAIPFTCGGDRRCPTGYRCSSDFCIREDAPPLPPLLDRSRALFTPHLQPDPDRGGLVACWTRQEDLESAQGGLFAAFMNARGEVTSPVRLAAFDTRGAAFLATCAPVPGTRGKIAIAAWFQRQAQAEQRILIWEPTVDNGTSGGDPRPFYNEVSPLPSTTTARELEATVVGDEAWIPMQQSEGMEPNSYFLPKHRVYRLRIGAAQIEAGAPIREPLNRSPTGIFLSPFNEFLQTRFVGMTGGAWAVLGSYRAAGGFFHTERRSSDILWPILPEASPGFGIPLAGFDPPDPMMPRQLALLLNDAYEPPTVGEAYRVAWMRSNDPTVTMGPVVPFSRFDTPRPASFVIDGKLYLIGTQVGAEIPPRPAMPPANGADAGSGESADAGASESDRRRGPLNIYRVDWGADQMARFQRVSTIQRALGEALVPAAAARPMPGDPRHFAMAWIEFYPRDAIGHGARYVLFMDRFPLAN